MIMYGLQSKQSQKLLCYSYKSGQFLFTEHGHLWLVDSKQEAQYARLSSIPVFDNSYETPSHSYAPAELEVVKLEINVKKKGQY